MTIKDDKESPGSNYGFYGRLKAEFPSQIVVDITERCNLACAHCPHEEFKKSEYYSGKDLEPELNKKLVDEIREHGQGVTQYIRYTSDGEPLLHHNSYEMIEYAVRNSGVFVTLTTNGTIMNERRTTELLESGIHMIDISIDAFRPETYAKIRRGGKLEVTRKNVLNLIKWIGRTGSNTKVVVSFIEQPENASEASDFEKFWKDHGASYVVVRRLHSCSGAIADLAEEMRKESSDITRRPCLYPWERITLNPRGYLAFCPTDWTRRSLMVDFRTATVSETWRGEFYRRLREAHLSCNFEEFGFCGQCPDWAATRWPDEGRSYADMIEDFKEKG